MRFGWYDARFYKARKEGLKVWIGPLKLPRHYGPICLNAQLPNRQTLK